MNGVVRQEAREMKMPRDSGGLSPKHSFQSDSKFKKVILSPSASRYFMWKFEVFQ